MAIYKDEKRGTYYFSVYIGEGNRRKRVLRRGFKTRPEATRAEAEVIVNAELYLTDNPLFNDIVDEYLSFYEKRRKATSLHKISKDCNLYIKPFFKNKFIKHIKRRDILRFHDFLLEKLSLTSAKNTHGTLSSILNHAIKLEYINKNVAREVGNIKGSDDKRLNYWTLDEFKVFLSNIEDDVYRALFMTLFYSGMRIGEAVGLTWQDIDFENNIMNISKTAYQGKVTSPKTKTSIRKLKMPKHTINMISQIKLETKPKHDYYVFGEFYTHKPHTTVNAFFRHNIKRINKGLKDEGKLKLIRVHDLRHSHASYLINGGYDIQIVSKRLGHAKVSTTYDTYAHLYPNKEDEAVASMEDDFKAADVIKIVK